MSESRNETEVLAELSEDARVLLKRVFEIERSKLHLGTAGDTSIVEEIYTAVKGILP